MDLKRFENVQLLPAAQRYRDFLDEATQHYGWDIAVAIVTIFIEGTKHERAALDPANHDAPLASLKDHPLVKYYGLSLEYLALTRAHRKIEGNHREAAWASVLNHVAPRRRGAVVRVMNEAVEHWLAYRDEVAESCGLRRESVEFSDSPEPQAAAG